MNIRSFRIQSNPLKSSDYLLNVTTNSNLLQSKASSIMGVAAAAESHISPTFPNPVEMAQYEGMYAPTKLIIREQASEESK